MDKFEKEIFVANWQERLENYLKEYEITPNELAEMTNLNPDFVALIIENMWVMHDILKIMEATGVKFRMLDKKPKLKYDIKKDSNYKTEWIIKRIIKPYARAKWLNDRHALHNFTRSHDTDDLHKELAINFQIMKEMRYVARKFVKPRKNY